MYPFPGFFRSVNEKKKCMATSWTTVGAKRETRRRRTQQIKHNDDDDLPFFATRSEPPSQRANAIYLMTGPNPNLENAVDSCCETVK